MAERVTLVKRRTLAQPDSGARVTLVKERILAQPDSVARVTLVKRRVLVTNYGTPGQYAYVAIIE